MLRRLFLPALNFVLPVTCARCDVPVNAQHAPALCPTCFDGLQFHEGPQCHVCATRVEALFVRPELVCGSCLASPPPFAASRAPFVYGDTARDLVLGLKHGGRRVNATFLGGHMIRKLPTQRANSVLVPIPLHPSRVRERGFNQALLLATHIGRKAGFPMLKTALMRTKATASQGTQSAKARARNVAGAFRVPDPALIKGKNLILIDDVITSGATARSAAQVLTKAGATSVLVLAATRALPK